MMLVDAVLTPIRLQDLANEFVLNLETLGVEPKRAPIELKLAHVCVECNLVNGLIRKCYCNNLGNVKHVDGDGFNWCMFECGENVFIDEQGRLPAVLRSPFVLRVGRPWRVDGRLKQAVKIRPPHDWSRFRAFDTLLDGMRGQFSYLAKHPKVLAALQTGDVATYNAALDQAEYYTAEAHVYENALRTRLREVQTLLRDWNGWGNVT